MRKTDGGRVVDIETNFPIKKVSLKIMDSGETRVRCVLENGDTVVQTCAAAGINVQNAHSYKGLLATYEIQAGWIVIVSEDGDALSYVVLYADLPQGPKQYKTRLREDHVVITGSNALFLTTKIGYAIPNPQRGGNDWWPVSAAFQERLQQLDLDVIAQGIVALGEVLTE